MYRVLSSTFITLMLISLPLLASDLEKEKAAFKAAEDWIQLMDQGNYAESWIQASKMFKSVITQQQWEAAMLKLRQPLGNNVTRALIQTDHVFDPPGVPEGEYFIIDYQSSFDNKNVASENIILMLQEDNSWRTAGYFVR